MPTNDWMTHILRLIQQFSRNDKSLGSGGSMVARLKLKRIDGTAHQHWNLRLNLIQRGKSHERKTYLGMTD
jgi:hypothetical protein